MKEKIKFPDAYVHGSFSPSDEVVKLLFEGRRAVVATTYHKRKVSAGVELGALDNVGEGRCGQGMMRWRNCQLFRCLSGDLISVWIAASENVEVHYF